MGNLFAGLAAGVAGGLVVFAALTLTGTVVYFFWPAVIPFVFPGAVKAGLVAAELTWGKAVLFTWLCGLLFKGSSLGSALRNANKKDEEETKKAA